jgi:hypothetical protein
MKADFRLLSADTVVMDCLDCTEGSAFFALGSSASLGKNTFDYGAWTSYAWARLKGWEPGEARVLPALAGRRDRQKFADFYREHDATSFLSSSMLQGRPPVFTGPISYAGHALQDRRGVPVRPG